MVTTFDQCLEQSSNLAAVPEYLIYAMETELRSLHLDPDELSQPWSPVTGLNGAVALDFDYADKMIYFTQVTTIYLKWT